RPPEKGFPPGAVWQAAQSAARVRYWPRAMRSAPARVGGTPVGFTPRKSARSTRVPLANAVGSPERNESHATTAITTNTTARAMNFLERVIVTYAGRS